VAALSLAGGALAALAPATTAADVSVVATPPNPVVAGPGEISFEPGLVLVVKTTETDTTTLVNHAIQPPGPPN
jgi:hypothetical protein